MDALGDDQLHPILLCFHPALPRESRAALTLRLVVGTSTGQIARLFLVPTPTMAARLTRATQKIVLAGIPLGVPPADELRSRLDEVCRTIYLDFTAGYTPVMDPTWWGRPRRRGGPAVRRVVRAGARRATGAGAAGHAVASARSTRCPPSRWPLVTLAEQDRSLWRSDEIRAVLALVEEHQPADRYAEELRLQVGRE